MNEYSLAKVQIVLLIVFCYRYFCDCKKNVTRMTLI